MHHQSESNPPFIIWTLQRTGGTNLARRLFERSGILERVRASEQGSSALLAPISDQWRLHEPFNIGDSARPFGRITEEWMARHDTAALEQAIGEVCSLGLPIKHCVEMVPAEVNATLARVAIQHGYRHLFLYRKRASGRLLSLHFAKLSGIWGAHARGKRQLEAEIFAEPLPVDELSSHEAFCTRRLDQVWEMLESGGGNPIAVAFEDIYEAESVDAVRGILYPLLADLGLAAGADKDRAFANDIVKIGEQGTRDKYALFPNVDELEAALAELPGPAFSKKTCTLTVENMWSGSEAILHAAIDTCPDSVDPWSAFDISGVLVQAEPGLQNYAVSIGDGRAGQRIQYGIRSPKMEKKYPQSPNSAHCRFAIKHLLCRPGDSLDVVLKKTDGEGEQPVFRLTMAPADQNRISR